MDSALLGPLQYSTPILEQPIRPVKNGGLRMMLPLIKAVTLGFVCAP
jgi:hypothetical protein